VSVPPDYVELHCHSGFSLLDGASNPETLMARAAGVGMPAVALTDHDDLGGAVRWAEAGKEHGLEAIVGLEVTVGDPASHLTLLAMDQTGYRNLSRLVTLARSGERGAPSAPWAEVERHAAGLFCLTGCPFGEVPQRLAKDDEAGARAQLGWLAEIFDGRVAVECWDHALASERALVPGLVALAGSLDLPWVVTNDVHYATPRGRKVHDVLTCLRHQTTLDEAGALLRPNGEWYLKRPERMAHRWRHYPEGIVATREIAGQCAFRMAALTPTLPAFPTPPGVSADDHLAALVAAGARERYGDRLTEQHRAQLRHELDVIRRLGLAGYFLIVWDIVREANRLGVLAQGRGSAANSAVCYCLGITAIDPVGMELLFERFLSEDRREAPDIDIDFAHNDREEVIQYVYRRYGRDHAAMVCEAITYRGRAAVRDAARVLGFSVQQAEKLADEADRDGARETGEKLLAGGAAAADLDPADHRVRMLAEVVRGLHQLPRHRSIHVGGFVLSAEPLADVVPIEPAAMPERTVIQWDKDDLDPVRLIKIDLLGLGMLTMLQEAIRLVRLHRGVAVDLARLPMTDPAVYDLLCRADTIGVFQVESRAQMNTLPRLAPRAFYDLVVEVALIRPGPIQGEMVHPYLRRRAGLEPVTYPHPSLEPILERTLGVPLFQEQGMQVAIAAAGFTPGEADELRRAMGHKRSHERMAKICGKLVDGMAKNGIEPDVARRIFNQISAFADYGFPESHAASFALLVYASAYVKLYYPAEFACALLNAQPMGFYSPGTIVEDARRHGVEVRGVDVMASGWDCTLESTVARRQDDEGGSGCQPSATEDGTGPGAATGPFALRIGLRYVAGLGARARERIEPLLAAGRPASLEGWVRESGLTVPQLRALAEAGAFDRLWPNRRSALWEVLKHARGAAGPLAPVAQDRRAAPVPALTPVELTEADYRVTGLSPAGHPMRHLRAAVAAMGAIPAAGLERRRDGDWVTVAGLVICRQRPGTAKGFCFVTLEDETGLANVVITPRLFEAHKRLIRHSPLLVVAGVLQEEQGVLNVRGKRFAAPAAAAGAAFVTSHDFH
jgi:error-prone DNA polymerase